MNQFNDFIKEIRSDNPEIFENAYLNSSEFIENYLDKIIQIMISEKNPSIKSRFIELIGESKNNAVIPYLLNLLKDENPEIRSWSFIALGYLKTPEAENARQNYKRKNPQEIFYDS